MPQAHELLQDSSHRQCPRPPWSSGSRLLRRGFLARLMNSGLLPAVFESSLLFCLSFQFRVLFIALFIFYISLFLLLLVYILPVNSSKKY
uniref:Uncharacterized protein n=1 Tax=Physcomitrium patens TaxID=3218 RepID=A0A2K1L0X9_PHYPA|nr:hypothetical protein PHYPA_002481 [Physcomitrium patens]